jgi:carbon starvation protein
VVWIMVFDTLRVCYNFLNGRTHPPLAETPHVPTRLSEAWIRD